ncbi:hypothetical protein N656DRAFT_714602 [Canariomyces notabilis]|uniref:AB hydrolase-1 domain-containing protein n=1 Tax=Canariomyces notabilis TaxID=2074819 RepID=A0AAN6TAP2_9PEZI|nr:hypothetical protein N656DRAFT_714602 [Canariomyces arenarius]
MRQVFTGNIPATNGTTTVSDTFTIKGTYCAPHDVKARDTLEVFVHGAMYNKSIWAGMGFHGPYDWHKYANSRGYATLALDRLGHGDNPQHPDPLSVVQAQMHVEILHQIIRAARTASSPINVLGRAFNKVVYVGHSYGSALGAALGTQYPADADALVLTGYSSYVDFSLLAAADFSSAATSDPARFGGLPAGYVTMTNETQHRTALFFPGGYDPAIPPVDFAYRDTITVGEIGSLPSMLGAAAVNYTGAVLVTTAVQDAYFCEGDQAQCEAHLAATGDWFPNAVHYDYIAPDSTGHDLTLHYTARDTLKRVHAWLDAKL